jgi:hypothetical protein
MAAADNSEYVTALYNVCLEFVVARYQRELARQHYPSVRRPRSGQAADPRDGLLRDYEAGMDDPVVVRKLFKAARKLTDAVVQNPEQFPAIVALYQQRTARTHTRRRSATKPKPKRKLAR